jgi:hypothetical protein
MPLKKGSSQETISSNIRECIMSYKKSGKIGNIKPRNLKHAMSICSAAAYTSAKKSKKRSAISEALK